MIRIPTEIKLLAYSIQQETKIWRYYLNGGVDVVNPSLAALFPGSPWEVLGNRRPLPVLVASMFPHCFRQNPANEPQRNKTEAAGENLYEPRERILVPIDLVRTHLPPLSTML
jgi:hypothetical protein